MENLNWQAETVSGVFGYDTLQELTEKQPELIPSVALLLALSQTENTEAVRVLAGVLSVVTGQEINTTKKLVQYFLKLSSEELEDVSGIIVQTLLPSLLTLGQE